MTIMDTKAEQEMAATLDQVRKDIENHFTADTPPPKSDLTRFKAIVEKNREHLRKEILERESRFELERVRLIDSYRVKLHNLQNEASEALRALEQHHQRKAAEDREFFALLDAARGEPT